MTDKAQEISKSGRTYDRRGFRRVDVPKRDIMGEIIIDEKIHPKLDPDELPIPELPLRNEITERIPTVGNRNKLEEKPRH